MPDIRQPLSDLRFDWLQEEMHGKILDQLPIEKIVTRLLGILQQDRKCQEALDKCAVFVYGNIKGLSSKLVKNALLDPIFAQCDKCFACWVPNPVNKHFFASFTSNPIGIGCERCHRVLCRPCYQKLGTNCRSCGELMTFS